MGRCWVVPWMRSPARSRHHGPARGRASARSTKVSPAKNEPRTNCTWRSTRGLSCGERTPAGSILNPAGLRVLDERLVEAGLEWIGAVNDGGQVVGDQGAEDTTEEHPRRLVPVVHVR